jgi:hypothetical protein
MKFEQQVEMTSRAMTKSLTKTEKEKLSEEIAQCVARFSRMPSPFECVLFARMIRLEAPKRTTSKGK